MQRSLGVSSSERPPDPARETKDIHKIGSIDPERNEPSVEDLKGPSDVVDSSAHDSALNFPKMEADQKKKDLEAEQEVRERLDQLP